MIIQPVSSEIGGAAEATPKRRPPELVLMKNTVGIFEKGHIYRMDGNYAWGLIEKKEAILAAPSPHQGIDPIPDTANKTMKASQMIKKGGL